MEDKNTNDFHLFDFREFSDLVSIALQLRHCKAKTKRQVEYYQSQFEAICERVDKVFGNTEKAFTRWVKGLPVINKYGKPMELGRDHRVIFTYLVLRSRSKTHEAISRGDLEYFRNLCESNGIFLPKEVF